MRKGVFFILMISFPFYSSAQNKKVHFQSINQFAIIGGESHVNTAFQTVNGIKFSNWFSGIGIGIDCYRYKTLPLFADGRWFFGEDKKGFLYGDIGYDFPLKNTPGKEMDYYTNYHFEGGGRRYYSAWLIAINNCKRESESFQHVSDAKLIGIITN